LIHQVRISTVSRYDKDFTPARRFEADAQTLALYHFDEGTGDVLKDSSGNGYHGKIINAKLVNADGTPIAALPANYALKFDEKSQVGPLSVPLEVSQPYTIEAYLTRGELKKKLGYECFIKSEPIRLGSTIDSFAFNVRAGKDTSGSPAHQLSFPAVNGIKKHVAGVYDGKEIILFVDGKRVKSKNIEDRPPSPGRTGLSFGPNFVGLLHQVHITQRALYDQDFQPAERLTAEADTLALYRFDEGQGDELKDSSGNGYHGRIVGARWVNADGTPIEAAGPK
jgi:hypothetical protein